jgi:hypothetical protein
MQDTMMIWAIGDFTTNVSRVARNEHVSYVHVMPEKSELKDHIHGDIGIEKVIENE